MKLAVELGTVFLGSPITRIDFSEAKFWTYHAGPFDFEVELPPEPECRCHPARVWQGHLLNCPVFLRQSNWRPSKLRGFVEISPA